MDAQMARATRTAPSALTQGKAYFDLTADRQDACGLWAHTSRRSMRVLAWSARRRSRRFLIFNGHRDDPSHDEFVRLAICRVFITEKP
jgi:hypothetical protein